MKTTSRLLALLGTAAVICSTVAQNLCEPDYLGDGDCDHINNKAECGYDSGDCCSCTCVSAEYTCGGGDNGYACIDPEAPCVDDDDMTAAFVENCGSLQGIGNGMCDPGNNKEICGYDGGDCCECTCQGADFPCGESGFACIDPEAPCVEDDDVTLEIFEGCGDATNFANGFCDIWNNNEFCGYDGGDCCECTCQSADFPCGESDFACIDPSAECVDDDDVTADMVEYCGYLQGVGDGSCDEGNNNDLCGFDGGDCCECTCQMNEDGDGCDEGFACIDPFAACVDDDTITVGMVENCADIRNVANGFCDDENNTEECGFDGGDCCECTCVKPERRIEDGDDYFWDFTCNNFACIDPSAPCVDDDSVTVDIIDKCDEVRMGNALCDEENNKPECNYDAGDCCSCTCEDKPTQACGGNQYYGFACIDPSAPCVDDDSITAEMYANCGDVSRIADGKCQSYNNTPECSYDGGDCCECTCQMDEDGDGCDEDFACIDPSAACVDDDSVTVDMIESCSDPTSIGNGYCGNGNNRAECNWDGGDCCSCDCEVPECGNQNNTFDCKNPASACFGEYIEPQYDDDYHMDGDDAMSYESTEWEQEGPLPTVPGAIEVGMLTEVVVSASAYDGRAGRSSGGNGCGDDGCFPAYSRDGIASEVESRWSCASKLVESGGPCQIEYSFAVPQDIVDIQVAFWKGNERVRSLKVHFGDVEVTTHESYSGSLFNTLGVTSDEVTSVKLEAVGLLSHEWISLIEVLIFAKHEFVTWVQEGPLPTVTDAVEVGIKTEVAVTATAYDSRTGMHGGQNGCGEAGGDGCVPAYTRDGIASEVESRWSCAPKLVDSEGPCQIEYTFADPQDIVGIQVAFWKGDERIRTLKVHLNGVEALTHESYSGSTFNSIGVEATGVSTVMLESVGLLRDEWISLIEVLIFVTP